MKTAGARFKPAGVRRFVSHALAVVVVLGGSPLSAKPAATLGNNECSVRERRDALASDQRLVLQRVGDLTTLQGVADVARLAAIGYSVPPHQFVSFRGMGMAVLDPSTLANLLPTQDPELGHPALLLYRPDPGAEDTTDPRGPDFPYTLAGWAYLDFQYHWAQTPISIPCLRRADWFVHERGVHPFADGGFVAVPPTEEFHGQADGAAPPPPILTDKPERVGAPHGRAWDTHIWLSRGGPVPTVSMLNPGEPIPGIDPQVGVAFFFPAIQP